MSFGCGEVLTIAWRVSIFFRRKSTAYIQYVQDVGFRIGNWGMLFRNWGNFLWNLLLGSALRQHKIAVFVAHPTKQLVGVAQAFWTSEQTNSCG